MPSRAIGRILLGAMAIPTLVLAGACEPAPAPPHNDNFAAATVLASASHGSVSATTIGSTRQPGEPPSLAPTTVWFRWVAPVTGAVTFTASSGMSMLIEPFTGVAVNRLHLLPVDESSPESGFRTVAGTVYMLRVSSFSGTTFGLSWQTRTAPVNDHRAAASAITGASGSLIADNTAATNDVSDPGIQGDRPPGTIWYRWTAPAAGWYDFDTNGSQLDTELGIYTNAATPQLVDDSTGDCSDSDDYESSAASVGFQAASGSSYLVMVATSASGDPGAADLGGPVQLNWHPEGSAPVASGNDAFAAPARISGTNGSLDATTVGATAEPGEPAHAPGVPARSSVWFSWTPPVTTDYLLTSSAATSSGCEAGLTVYKGSTLSALTAAPYLDDPSESGLDPTDGSGIGSADYAGILSSGSDGVMVHLVAGTTYRISADRIAQPGAFVLRWDIPQAAPIIRSVTPGNGSIGIIWAPPPRTAGSQRTGYFVTAIPASGDGDFLDFSSDEPLTLPVTSAFTTIHGLTNGTAYRIIIAAVNGSGVGDFATSRPVTPAKVR